MDTPKDEPVTIKVGKSFDVLGKRTQTDFHVDTNRRELDESFSISLHNHKDVAVHVIIREYLYRWSNWEIVSKSDPFDKINSRTIEFPVDVPANGDKTVTYKVHYSW